MSVRGQGEETAECAECVDLRLEFQIRTPADLSKAIRIAKANLSDGTLEELLPATQWVWDQPPLGSLSVEGPWPDVISYTLRCRACRQRFNLSAETYHGCGGSWSPLDD